MTNEQKRVHLRLSTTLPSRFHYKPSDVDNRGLWSVGGRARKAVEIDGVKYESMSDAARKTGKTRQHIHHMIDIGTASYADRD